MSERKAVIKNADMSEDMQQDAVDCASQALEKYNIEKVRIIIRLISSLLTIQLTSKISYLKCFASL
jgi:Dynein light chain type 1